MIDADNLGNHFLISVPRLQDRFFYQAVVYLCEHNEHGAMGLAINKPLSLNLAGLLDSMDIAHQLSTESAPPVLMGGLVQPERGFIIHPPDAQTWESSIALSPSIQVTSSLDILEALAKAKGPEHLLITLGYSGWGAGQLEAEIKQNIWLVTPAVTDILFHTPLEQRWQAAIANMGFAHDQFSGDIGHD